MTAIVMIVNCHLVIKDLECNHPRNMTIENNKTTFVRLWQELERTRRAFGVEGKHFCIRRVVQTWARQGLLAITAEAGVSERAAINQLITRICYKCQLLGYDELPLPCCKPKPHREFLRALVSEQLGIGMRSVDTGALDEAYQLVLRAPTDAITLYDL